MDIRFMEEKEIEIPMFRPVKVFDVSQTDGKPLPELASSLSGTVPHYEAFLEALPFQVVADSNEIISNRV